MDGFGGEVVEFEHSIGRNVESCEKQRGIGAWVLSF